MGEVNRAGHLLKHMHVFIISSEIDLYPYHLVISISFEDDDFITLRRFDNTILSVSVSYSLLPITVPSPGLPGKIFWKMIFCQVRRAVKIPKKISGPGTCEKTEFTYSNRNVLVEKKKIKKVKVFQSDNDDLFCHHLKKVIMNRRTGPGCSKLTMSLVNVSLNFQKLISQICQYFLLKKCEKAFSFKFDQMFTSVRWCTESIFQPCRLRVKVKVTMEGCGIVP